MNKHSKKDKYAQLEDKYRALDDRGERDHRNYGSSNNRKNRSPDHNKFSSRNNNRFQEGHSRDHKGSHSRDRKGGHNDYQHHNGNKNNYSSYHKNKQSHNRGGGHSTYPKYEQSNSSHPQIKKKYGEKFSKKEYDDNQFQAPSYGVVQHPTAPHIGSSNPLNLWNDNDVQQPVENNQSMVAQAPKSQVPQNEFMKIPEALAQNIPTQRDEIQKDMKKLLKKNPRVQILGFGLTDGSTGSLRNQLMRLSLVQKSIEDKKLGFGCSLNPDNLGNSLNEILQEAKMGGQGMTKYKRFLAYVEKIMKSLRNNSKLDQKLKTDLMSVLERQKQNPALQGPQYAHLRDMIRKIHNEASWQNNGSKFEDQKQIISDKIVKKQLEDDFRPSTTDKYMGKHKLPVAVEKIKAQPPLQVQLRDKAEDWDRNTSSQSISEQERQKTEPISQKQKAPVIHGSYLNNILDCNTPLNKKVEQKHETVPKINGGISVGEKRVQRPDSINKQTSESADILMSNLENNIDNGNVEQPPQKRQKVEGIKFDEQEFKKLIDNNEVSIIESLPELEKYLQIRVFSQI